MLALAFWIAVVLAVLAVVVTIVSAARNRPEALGFLRLTLTSVFGVVIGQALAPLGWRWWVTALVSLAMMLSLLIGSQLAARILGHRPFGKWLSRVLGGVVRSVTILFTPLSLPKEEVPEEFEQELLDSVEEFGETIVREVMVPRVDMATIPADSSLEQAIRVFLERGHSRLPVVGKNVDDVIGVLYLKDIVRLTHREPDTVKLAGDLARKPIFVPESKPVDDLLREMQLSSTHMALVIDEYGGVAGLVTMEDVIEEIVGDISDEYDKEIPDFEEYEIGLYRVSARFSLFDLGEHFGLELEDEDVDTVGGLLTKELGRLPLKGDSVVSSGLEFRAERIEGRRKRLITVLVRPLDELTQAQEAFE
jgi:Mg2+/Co2+ transporter CorC